MLQVDNILARSAKILCGQTKVFVVESDGNEAIVERPDGTWSVVPIGFLTDSSFEFVPITWA